MLAHAFTFWVRFLNMTRACCMNFASIDVAGRPSLDWLLKTRYNDHFEPLVGWEAGTCCRNDSIRAWCEKFGPRRNQINTLGQAAAGCWVLPRSSVLGVPPSVPFQQDRKFERFLRGKAVVFASIGRGFLLAGVKHYCLTFRLQYDPKKLGSNLPRYGRSAMVILGSGNLGKWFALCLSSGVRSSLRFWTLWLQITVLWLHECCMGFALRRERANTLNYQRSKDPYPTGSLGPWSRPVSFQHCGPS